MRLNLDYIDGLTPVGEDEKEGLLIQTISTRGELDEFEQANIRQAVHLAGNDDYKALIEFAWKQVIL
jgi:hypothetical protein